MRQRKKLIVGREDNIPAGAVFERGKYYIVVGKSDENGMTDFCSIDRLALISVRLKYDDGVEHLNVYQSPFNFSSQHRNWLRNYLNKKYSRQLSESETRDLEKVFSAASQDGLGEDVRKLAEICSEE